MKYWLLQGNIFFFYCYEEMNPLEITKSKLNDSNRYKCQELSAW